MIDVSTATQEKTASAPSRLPRRHPEAVGFQSFLELEFPEARERVEGLLPAQGLALLLAAEKTGKSLLGLQLGMCVASGSPFLGRDTARCPVLLIEEEGTELEMQSRMSRQASALGLIDHSLELFTSVCPRYRLDDPVSLVDLEAEVLRTQARLVILGPLAQLAEVRDENASAEINAIVRTLVDVSRRHDALVVLVHHRRKDDRRLGPPTSVRAFFDSSRGSSALTGGIDAGIGLVRDPEAAEGRFYSMRRNGPSHSFGATLDFETLLFTSTEPVTPAQHPTLAAVEQAVLGADEPIARARVAKLVACSPTTARTRLDALVDDGRLCRQLGPRGVQLYGPPGTRGTLTRHGPGPS